MRQQTWSMWLFFILLNKVQSKVSDIPWRGHPGCFPAQSKVNRIAEAWGGLSRTRLPGWPRERGQCGKKAEIRHRRPLDLVPKRKRLCWDNLFQPLGIYILGQKKCTAFDPVILLLEIQEEEIVADVCEYVMQGYFNHTMLFIVEKTGSKYLAMGVS